MRPRVTCAGDDAGRDVCTVAGQNSLICSKKPVTVRYTKPTTTEEVKNFKVNYQLVQPTTDVIECNATQLTATIQKNTFDVYQDVESIPNNYHCQWSITDSTDKPIRVSIDTVSTEVSLSFYFMRSIFSLHFLSRSLQRHPTKPQNYYNQTIICPTLP
ncbi:hypothetical protein FBUS_09796 [Fasciolopsis buskii]|uniref:CUB domain-containing protein n=1 Tax=Fasciolopsis buskii TaxID=27845 RepID=A0A8E0S3V2_9TREM|nr:hypothetical protein FBUS_09796 [Fasciolopsis buski]